MHECMHEHARTHTHAHAHASKQAHSHILQIRTSRKEREREGKSIAVRLRQKQTARVTSRNVTITAASPISESQPATKESAITATAQGSNKDNGTFVCKLTKVKKLNLKLRN